MVYDFRSIEMASSGFAFLGDQYYFEDKSQVEIDVVKQDNTSWSVQIQTPKITFNQRDLRYRLEICKTLWLHFNI